MSLGMHQRAEQMMALGDVATAEGDMANASAYYAAAASAEVDAFHATPADRRRTRGIVAVSAVALYRKAGHLADARRNAHLFLADDVLDEDARATIEDLLSDLRTEIMATRDGRSLGRDWFEWRIKGPSVGDGTAPLPLVGQKVDQILRYATRVYELLAHQPLRIQGPVDASVRDSMGLVMSQPAAGSFKFRLRLSVPEGQTSLWDGGRPLPADRVNDTFFRILEAVVADNAEDLAAAVPDDSYQDAFLHLVRNLLPDGKDLSSIEVTRRGNEMPAIAVLTPQQRGPINRRLRARRAPRSARQKEMERVDVLRALHLNEGWIVLGTPGHETKCFVGKALVLEDAVEGLVNQVVRVTGHVERGRFVIEDVVAAAGSDMSA